MADKSSESSTGTTTRRRRTVRKSDDAAAAEKESNQDDALDVIFEEPGEESLAPKKKKATRRRKKAARVVEGDDSSDSGNEPAAVEAASPREESAAPTEEAPERRPRRTRARAASTRRPEPAPVESDDDFDRYLEFEGDESHLDDRPVPVADVADEAPRRGRRPARRRDADDDSSDARDSGEAREPQEADETQAIATDDRPPRDGDDDDDRPRRRRRRRRRRGGAVPGEAGYQSDRPAHSGDRHPQSVDRSGGDRGGSDRGGSDRSGGADRGPAGGGDRGRRGRGGRVGNDRPGNDRGDRGERNDRADRSRRGRGQQQPNRVRNVAPSAEVFEGTMEGVLELHPKGYGFLRSPEKNYIAQESDPFVPSSFVEKHRLREGVLIRGEVGQGVRNQGPRLKDLELIEGRSPEDYQSMKDFDELIPVTPYKHITLETGVRPATMRVMDLLTPVGKGQRALIVAPPRTGKTMLLQDIADAVSANHPEVHLMVLLIDERPEEVTEMRRRVKGEVIASSMDRDVESHVRMSQLIVERAKRMAECGKDVFILMDSITRMARAFNKWSGGGNSRHAGTMSGGLHVKALDIPKKLFGTARQFEDGGSVTIVATALIETGGKMDDVIFQEFKGTGNMELVLSRELADRRIWPAIDITRSGTRHEEKLFKPEEFDSIVMLRRSLISLSPVEAMEQLTRALDRFPTNTEFLAKVKTIL
jgi:transcription termination factor Rho